MYSFKGWILWYTNFISIRLLLKHYVENQDCGHKHISNAGKVWSFFQQLLPFIKFWGALSSSTVCPLRFLPFEVLQTKHVFKIIKKKKLLKWGTLFFTKVKNTDSNTQPSLGTLVQPLSCCLLISLSRGLPTFPHLLAGSSPMRI